MRASSGGFVFGGLTVRRLHPLVAVALVGLSLLAAPSARAFTTFEATYVGILEFASSLDYPCAQYVSTLGAGPLPCVPRPPSVDCRPLNGTLTGGIPNCHPHFFHNLQGVSLVTTTCVGMGATLAKTQAPITGPGCSFVGSGHVDGFCGLAGGQLSGLVTVQGSPYSVDLQFTDVGGTLLTIGHYRGLDGHHGLVIGVALVVPQVNDCRMKTADTFTVVGTITGIPEPLL